MSDIKKVVLAYSGGLDTSIILKWIKNTYNCEVVTFTADLGQGEELDGVEAKALATGATKAYVEDIREEYARDFVFPMLRAAALYEGRYLLGTSIARPLIAKRMCEIAEAEGAQAVAHGATGKGNDQVRFELTTMRSRKVSPGSALMRMTIASDSTRVPPVTALLSPPASRMTGALSPVMALSSTLATPSMISPSQGMVSPV